MTLTLSLHSHHTCTHTSSLSSSPHCTSASPSLLSRTYRRSSTSVVSCVAVVSLLLSLLSVVSCHGGMEHEVHEAGTFYTHWTGPVALHATLMTIICMIGLPIGVVLAIAKSTWHKWYQSVLIVCLLLSVIPAYTDVGSPHGTSSHGIMGFVLIFLFTSQFAVGWVVKFMNTLHRTNRILETNFFLKNIKFVHRTLAAALCLMIPFQFLLGFAHGQNIEDDSSNWWGHTGIGMSLVLGGLFCELPIKLFQHNQSNARLWVEYAIWCVAGVVIMMTMHDWSQGFHFTHGGLHHIMMGFFTFLCGAWGMILIGIGRKLPISNPAYYRLPAALIYFLIALMMYYHEQSTEFGLFMHVAFGLLFLGIAVLHVWGASTGLIVGPGSYHAVQTMLRAHTTLEDSTSVTLISKDKIAPTITPAHHSVNGSGFVLASAVGDKDGMSTLRPEHTIGRHPLAWVQNTFMVMSGTVLAGAGNINMRNAEPFMMAPTYAIALCIFAMLLLGWCHLVLAGVQWGLKKRGERQQVYVKVDSQSPQEMADADTNPI